MPAISSAAALRRAPPPIRARFSMTALQRPTATLSPATRSTSARRQSEHCAPTSSPSQTAERDFPRRTGRACRRDHRRRRRDGDSGRRFRHRRRCGHCAGSFRGVPHVPGAGRGADAALHRHFARDHHPDRLALLPGARRPRPRDSQGAAAVDGAGDPRGRGRIPSRRRRAGRAVQNCVCRNRRGHFGQNAARARDLDHRQRSPRPDRDRAYGFLMGLASSLMGISGGSLVTIFLTLYRKTIHEAVATASGIGVPITIAGTLSYALAGLPYQSQLPPLSIGFVSIIGVVMIAPISSYVAPLGARLAHRLPRRVLEVTFGLFLVLASARFVLSLVYPGT